MNKDTINKIDVIAKNLSSLADQIKTMPESMDISASLPIIAATLRMQSANLTMIYEELAQPEE